MSRHYFFSTTNGDTFTGPKISVPVNAAITTAADHIDFNSDADLSLDVRVKDSGGGILKTALDYVHVEAKITVHSFDSTAATGCFVGLLNELSSDNVFATQVRSHPGVSTQVLAFVYTQGSQNGFDAAGGGVPIGSGLDVVAAVDLAGSAFHPSITYPGPDVRALPSPAGSLTLDFSATINQLPRLASALGVRFMRGHMTLTGLEVWADFASAAIAIGGDSLTQGNVADVPEHGYAQLLRANYSGDVAICGAPSYQTTDWQGAKWQGLLDMQPSRLLIELGVNDRKIGGRSAAAIQGTLTALVAQTAAASIIPMVALLPPLGDPVVVTVNDWIKLQGWEYVDFFSPLVDVDGISLKAEFDHGDGTHWNTAGHAAIFDELFLTLSSLPPPGVLSLSLTSRTASSVTVNLASGVGETSWEIEVNRDPEFSADESFFLEVAAIGDHAVPDLVPDTPYYFRARKTNGGNGAWSGTLMAATMAPAAAPVPPYNGFSIIPALLVVPEPVDDLVATNIEAGSEVDNLLNDDPMSVFRVAGASTSISFRTTGRPIDTFAILGTLANEDVTWRLRGASSVGDLTSAPDVDTGAVQLRISPGIGRRKFYHAFRRLTQTYTHEFWRIDIAGFTSHFSARNLIVGYARSSVNVSKGQGYEPIDLGSISRTQFGSPDRVRGWRARKVEFPLSWVSEAEYEAKWRDLDELAGTTDPVLAIPNPKSSVYLNDRIAFGEITSMRAEMMSSTKYAKTLELRSIY